MNDFQWTIAMQGWSFRSFNLLDALRQAAAIGVDAYEVIRLPDHGEHLRRQVIGGDWPDTMFGHHLDDVQADEVKAAIAETGVRLGSYCPWESLEDTPDERILAFAQRMDIPILTMEPDWPRDRLQALDRHAQAYGRRIAFHNHPAPSPYHDWRHVQALLQELSPSCGICGDTIHWTECGFDAMACIQAFADRHVVSHFNDWVQEADGRYRQVPLGDGVFDMRAALTLFRDLNVRQLQFVIEIPQFGDERAIPGLRQSLTVLRELIAEVLTPSAR